MNAQQNHAFGQLLDAWHRREDARSNFHDLRGLAEARFDLDTARDRMRSTLTAAR